jgi:hypothetical protein
MAWTPVAPSRKKQQQEKKKKKQGKKERETGSREAEEAGRIIRTDRAMRDRGDRGTGRGVEEELRSAMCSGVSGVRE